MATKMFPTSNATTRSSTTYTNAVTYRQLSLTQGASAATDTRNTTATALDSTNPPSAGSNIQPWGTDTTYSLSGGIDDFPASTLVFISEPISAVTISGTISSNLRALESNAMANYGIGFLVYRILSGNGAVNSRLGSASDNTTELGTTEAARTPSFTPTSTAFSNGDMIAVAIVYVTVGSNASGFTASGFYNGAAGATGDTFITFTETITLAPTATTPRNPGTNFQDPGVFMEGMEQDKRNHLWLPKRKIWRPRIEIPAFA